MFLEIRQRGAGKKNIHMLMLTELWPEFLFKNSISTKRLLSKTGVIFFNNNLWSKIVLHIVIYFCQKI